ASASPDTCMHLAERATEGVGERAAHGVAHQLGQQRAGCTDQRPRDDEGEVVQRETARRDGKTRARVEERDDHRHVCAADRQHKRHPEDQREDQQRKEGERNRRNRKHRDGEADDRCREQSVDDLLPRVRDRCACHQLLELGQGDHAPRKRDGADHDAEYARKDLRKRRMDAEKAGGEQVSEGDQGVHFGAGESAGRLAVCLPLNISSIRSVTTKPPTTLVVARVTATSPSTMVTRELAPAAIKIAPTRMMPWIALVPDIRGVWRMVGTLEITSKPTKIASTKKVSSLRSSLVMPPPPSASPAR